MGVYSDSVGNAYSFTYSEGAFQQLVVPGCDQSGAFGINNLGDIVGFCIEGRDTIGYLYKNGAFSFLSFPGAVGVQAFGVNDADEIVGYYAPPGTYDVFYGFRATPAN